MTDMITPQTLRFERLLDAPVDKAWRYLVDPELRARWFMAGPTDLKVGGGFGLTMDHDNLSDRQVPTPERYRPYIGKSREERMTRYEPPHGLAVLERRIRGEAAPDFWALHRQAEQMVEKVLGNPAPDAGDRLRTRLTPKSP